MNPFAKDRTVPYLTFTLLVINHAELFPDLSLSSYWISTENLSNPTKHTAALDEVGYFKSGGRLINKVGFGHDTAIIAKTLEELQDMVNRLVNTGRKYGMEINIDKSQVMRVSWSNESLQIK